MAAGVVEFGEFNPRQNLPARVGRKRGESNFAAAFQREYFGQSTSTGLCGKHFALPGYGIADIIWVDSSGDGHNLVAFELKLKDWRRGLMQALRYSYFADQSVVVLPPKPAKAAFAHAHIFRKLGLGLWAFDDLNGTVKKIIAPGRKGPKNPTARAKAISALRRRAKFRELSEQPYAAFHGV